MMCVLADGRGTPRPLHETDDAIVVLDRFGARRGHLLVILREHEEDVTALGSARYLELQRAAYEASLALQSALSPRRIFIAALGAPRSVPMSFPHVHLHVIPLFEEDERARPARVFSWTEGVVVYSEASAARIAAQIREAWPDADSGVRRHRATGVGSPR
jgi:diadenosine tetraphosphate (Ap4A) HIT family hydrolase